MIPGTLQYCQACEWWQSTAIMPDGECVCPVDGKCPVVDGDDHPAPGEYYRRDDSAMPDYDDPIYQG